MATFPLGYYRWAQPTSKLSAACGIVMALRMIHDHEMDIQYAATVCGELEQIAGPQALAEVAVLLAMRCVDGPSVLRKIALEAVAS